MNKALPFDENTIRGIAERYPTPFHLYDEYGITENARKFLGAFSWNPGFRQYFAVKALPNPEIVRLLHDLGFGADCSSLAELVLCQRLGILRQDVMFTSNDTTVEEFRMAARMGAIINLDDIGHIETLVKATGIQDRICLRYNPGDQAVANAFIGKPQEAKFGIPKDQLFQGYRQLRELGVGHFGLHTMVVSNELDPATFLGVAEMMFHLAVEIKEQTGIRVRFINLGGGLGIPYRPEQEPIDIVRLGRMVHETYDRIIGPSGLDPVSVLTECGRFITGPYGYLITRVLHIKRTFKNYIGLDACMADLMRPGMYGAYHHVTVVGKRSRPHDQMYDLTGSLCENNDKFAVDRMLPEVEKGDLIVIHDTGAHGHAMGFNYNGKLRSAEILLRPDGTTKMIRRAERLDDYFATVTF